MLTLYIGNKNYSSWSLRPWVLLRELGIPFRERRVTFGNDDFSEFSPARPQTDCTVPSPITVVVATSCG